MNLTPKEQNQPEWQHGDFVRDRDGDLWQYDDGQWHYLYAEMTTKELTDSYGPLHKVHVADPTKREVVISLDGIDRTALDHWADQAECSPRLWVQSKTAIRAAKAAREQLGEVQ